MTWYVLYENYNAREFDTFNIFDHWAFRNDCYKIAHSKDMTKEKFAEEVRRKLMYYFWSKCEWEVIVSAWPPSERVRDKKLDVYTQVMMNYDRFIDYTWEHRNELLYR